MQIKDFLNKTSRDATDKLLLQASNNAYYHIFASDFIAGLSSGGSGGWSEVSSSGSLSINGKYVITSATPITLTLPSDVLGEIEIYNNSSATISISISKYKSAGITAPMKLSGLGSYTRLLWINSTIGWIPLSGDLQEISIYLSGMSLHLEGGLLLDKSGNNNHATAVNSSTPPTKVTGLNSREVLRWNGSSTQELQVIPFLASATAATLYIVFSLNSNTQYNLIKTANLDDYWRFSGDGNGYFGTFSSSRRTGFPSTMPTTGNHLVSIHSNSSSYEVLLNNVSKGSQSTGFSAGDRFKIGANDKAFNGDIALLLVYPSLIAKTSTDHTSIVNAIRGYYPSLPTT